MDDIERYLFDLQGFLVLDDVLGSGELEQLNRRVDERVADDARDQTAGESFTIGSSGSESEPAGFLEWGKPFCDLVDHDRLMDVLKVLLGDGFRIDHYYGIQMTQGARGLQLHGGGTPYDPPEYYHFRNGKMYNGMTVVAWNLADSGGDRGGFVCIPGSHKSNYACPAAIKDAHIDAPNVICPDAPAGSVVVFTEALTHGTAPWKADHQRRSLLVKYCPAQQAWTNTNPVPPLSVELTDRQKRLFERPYIAQRPSMFHDGSIENF